MNRLKSSLKDISLFAIGEILVAAIAIGGFYVLKSMDVALLNEPIEMHKVIFGALLGVVVIVANYLWLSLAVDREINRFIEKRGKTEMDEEQTDIFVKKNAAVIQNAIQKSFIIRTISIFAALVIAFILDWFNPLATAIPMFAMRPVLTTVELIKARKNPKPDPNKFIKYDFDEEENDNEKEDN